MIKVFARKKDSDEKFEIKDLGWFYRNDVRSFEDERFEFEVVDGEVLEFKLNFILKENADLHIEDIIESIKDGVANLNNDYDGNDEPISDIVVKQINGKTDTQRT